MSDLTVMPMALKHNLYAIRLTDLFTEPEMAAALTRFKTKRGVIKSVVDFCDYSYIFGEDNLSAKEVHLDRQPHVFDAVVNASKRMRRIIGLDETLQIDSHRLTNTTVYVLVKYEVPRHERIGDL
jgi:hypothetical protein